jgi:hypothetical protein
LARRSGVYFFPGNRPFANAARWLALASLPLSAALILLRCSGENFLPRLCCLAASIVCGDNLLPFAAALILASCSGERFFPRLPTPILAFVSALSSMRFLPFLPLLAIDILALVSGLIGSCSYRNLWLIDILALVSAECVLPVLAAASFARCSDDLLVSGDHVPPA